MGGNMEKSIRDLGQIRAGKLQPYWLVQLPSIIVSCQDFGICSCQDLMDPCRAKYFCAVPCLEPIVSPETRHESRNLSWIQELIVNPGTHHGFRNPSWIQECIMNPGIHYESMVNPGIHQESRNSLWTHKSRNSTTTIWGEGRKLAHPLSDIGSWKVKSFRDLGSDRVLLY